MPDLDFGETDEEAILVLKGFAHRVNADLYNHGTKGLLTTFNTFVTAHDAREQERSRIEDEHHQENKHKINLVLALCAIGTLLIAAVSLFVTVEITKHSQLDPVKLFHSNADIPVLSWDMPQEAGSSIPPHY